MRDIFVGMAALVSYLPYVGVVGQVRVGLLSVRGALNIKCSLESAHFSGRLQLSHYPRTPTHLPLSNHRASPGKAR